ncbi:MAG: hypothetical protein JNL98_13145 [Bryobacterales bacterium]|nr:hypothetical protein [Bryobacterales bacterium]
MTKQLRSYIPIAGPARREAAEGTEPRVRAVLGFEPKWFRERCEIDFSERWHRDPDYRMGALDGLLKELRRRFPRATQWHGAEERHTWTIGGCYGVGVIPRVFGMQLDYYADRWPVLLPGTANLDCLDAERLLEGEAAQEILTQVDAMRARGIPVTGDLNWQGVLNVAFHLRGQDIFLDLADRPEWAAELFDSIASVIIGLAHKVQAMQRESGFDIDYMCVSNCTVNMVSPAMYSRMLAARDARIAESFDRFGVHTCNWDVTPYLKALARLPKVGYLDMGLDSDLKAARAQFPESRLAVLYSPWKLIEASEEQLRADIERARADLAPCDIVMADIPWNATDDQVNRFLAICENAAERAA